MYWSKDENSGFPSRLILCFASFLRLVSGKGFSELAQIEFRRFTACVLSFGIHLDNPVCCIQFICFHPLVDILRPSLRVSSRSIRDPYSKLSSTSPHSNTILETISIKVPSGHLLLNVWSFLWLYLFLQCLVYY